ncbi:MAG: type II toxin-antitoxin system RelE/ParE family toxin [Gammaproteobacteria bacterium]
MRVHWTPEARAQLVGIHDYIAQESSSVAKRVTQRIASRCEQIAALPRSGHKARDFNRDDIRELFSRPYRIIYRIKPEQIDILTVMHYRRLLPRDWRKLRTSQEK